MANLKQITEILHTIFCRRQHESEIINYEKSDKCCYYLEQSIEDTWECDEHKFWQEQAEFFLSLSVSGIDMLEQIVAIYRAAEILRNANPLYMRYVENILNLKGEKK